MSSSTAPEPSIAGGLPTAAGFTRHLLAARDALALSIAAPAWEAVDRDLAWHMETQERLRPNEIAARIRRGQIEDIFRVGGHERLASSKNTHFTRICENGTMPPSYGSPPHAVGKGVSFATFQNLCFSAINPTTYGLPLA